MIKIFYKKDYFEVLEEKFELKKEFEQFKKDSGNTIRKIEENSFKQLEEISKLKDSKLKQEVTFKEETKNLKLKIDVLEEDLKKEKKSNGSLTKENNKLKKEIDDLKAQIDDLKSDRYLVRKISSGRPRNTQKTSIRSSANESRAIKYVKERL